jgi:hypothetical protein
MSKEPFNLPATLVTPEFASILGLGLLAIALVWGNQFDVPLSEQPRIEWVRVIGFVTDETLRWLVNQKII